MSARMKRAADMTNDSDPLRVAVSQALYGTPVAGDAMKAAKIRLRLYAGLNDWALENLFAPRPDENPCRILIGDTTLAHLGNRFETEYVANLALKGKQQKVDVYRVIGRASGAAATLEPAARPATWEVRA